MKLDYPELAYRLLNEVPEKLGKWQAKDVSASDAHDMRELLGVTLEIPVPSSIEMLQQQIKPNLPWAEDHFKERVAGLPLNPGVEFRNWPWYKNNVDEHRNVRTEVDPDPMTCLLPHTEACIEDAQNGPERCTCSVAARHADGVCPCAQSVSDGLSQFSHTYMERYWPRWAGQTPGGGTLPAEAEMINYREGIRYRYGDLQDVITLLNEQPLTRQAYLPVWFPEDTGAVDGQRVPCSLGYHFMIRGQRLHCWYSMRSCDFVRYLRDDIYLTSRLMQHISEYLVHDPWIAPGTLHMTISSLHAFRGDTYALNQIKDGKR